MEEHWKQKEGDDFINVFLHSVAFGSLKARVAEDPKDELIQAQLEMTLHIRGNNLICWVQDLFRMNMIGSGCCVCAMTSTGTHRVIPKYGAVSAAKGVLESHIRRLANELVPFSITVDATQTGVTVTPRPSKIPGMEKLAEFVRLRNPRGRLPEPQDVAVAIAALSRDKTYWMTGNVIRLDGGDDIVT